MVTLLLLTACVHPASPAGSSTDDSADQPRLPAPTANVYTHLTAKPADPVVAQAMADAPWDEALAGAAAAVALELAASHTLDAFGLRWRAVLAAYPYPIIEQSVERAPRGQIPATLADHARKRALAGADVGVVRARSGEEDLWVLLVGDRRADLPPIPREYKLGESVTLGATSFLISDPLGQLRPASAQLALDMEGEWLLQARDSQGAYATLPLYVGLATPREPPILDDARGSSLDDQTKDLLSAMWHWYGRGEPKWDETLGIVASARLRALSQGAQLAPVDRQVHAAGFVGVPAAGAECRAASVAACLDGMWWSPDRRGVLVGGFTEMGLATQVKDGQVTIVLVGAG